MEVSVYHIQINVSDAKVSIPFYKALFVYSGYRVIDESSGHIGVSNGTTDFWIIETEKTYKGKGFHRKATGLNHISFKVASKQNVDIFVREFLMKRKVSLLYGGPKEFPEYKKGYYAVFFEDPDRLKLEVTFLPSK